MTKQTVALLAILLSPILLQAEGTPAASRIRIDQAAIGTAIDDKEITGTGTEFAATIDRLYCWTKVVADDAPVKIKHVWSLNGKKEADVSLEVPHLITRTWSSKRVRPGAWKVDITDQAGAVLSSVSFTVRGSN